MLIRFEVKLGGTFRRGADTAKSGLSMTGKRHTIEGKLDLKDYCHIKAQFRIFLRHFDRKSVGNCPFLKFGHV